MIIGHVPRARPAQGAEPPPDHAAQRSQKSAYIYLEWMRLPGPIPWYSTYARAEQGAWFKSIRIGALLIRVGVTTVAGGRYG